MRTASGRCALDVFAADTLRGAGAERLAGPGFGPLCALEEVERGLAAERLAEVLKRREGRLLMADLVAWLQGLGDHRRRLVETPFASLVTRRVKKWRRRVEKQSRHLAIVSMPGPPRRPNWSERGSKYAGEFAAEILGVPNPRRHGRLVRACTRLQTCLGDLNDIAVTRDHAADLARQASGDATTIVDIGFAAGALASARRGSIQDRTEAAERAARKFRRARRG